MSTYKSNYPTRKFLETAIDVALGKQKADLVIKNARFLDVFNGQFVLGDIAIYQGYIMGVDDQYEGKKNIDAKGNFLVPGFIDAHIHTGSSLLMPNQLQRLILPCGTTTIIFDPHEIANIVGKKGLIGSLVASKNLLLDCFMMLSSCVPATSPNLNFETSGAIIESDDLTNLVNHPRVLGLAELMNYPGLLNKDPGIISKVRLCQHLKIDGHAPCLSGKKLNAYAVAGIHSDHESITLKEAKEKLEKGIHILIREGSISRNADALLPLLNRYSSSVIGLCTDDIKPNDIVKDGHINFIINKALKLGIAPEIIFKVASYAPASFYRLEDRGAIAPGYIADFCLIHPKKNNWKKGFIINAVYKKGKRITQYSFKSQPVDPRFHLKNMHMKRCRLSDFNVLAKAQKKVKVRVIKIHETQLITDTLIETLPVIQGKVQSNLKKDILKIAVFERHHYTGYHTVGFVTGFKLKAGAIASTIAHDSHNLIVIGTDDHSMQSAVNELIRINGGLVAVNKQGKIQSFPLPIGGLVSDKPVGIVLREIRKLKQMIKKMGCQLHEPFLQMAFLALPVIPSLKITDRGLIDVAQFKIVPVVIEEET